MADSLLWTATVFLMVMYISDTAANSCEKASARHVTTLKTAPSHVVPLQHGLPGGFSVAVEGKIGAGASHFEVDLLLPEHKRFVEDSSLLLQLKFNIIQKTLVLNSYLGEKWGQAHTSPGIPFHSGGPFKVTIEPEGSNIKVLVNDRLLTSRPYLSSPERVSHVRLSGNVTDAKVIYTTASVSCRVDLNLRTKILQVKGTVPYVSQLDGSLTSGTALSIVGTMHSSGSWLAINLQSDGQRDKRIALQFMPRIFENTTVLNTFKDGAWGREVRRAGSLPVLPGQDFVITFHCLEREFKICVNGQTFTTYKHIIDSRTVNKAFINGDITLHGVLFHSNEKALLPQTTYCPASNSSSPIVCQPKPKKHVMPTPQHGGSYSAPLHKGFTKGAILELSGILAKGEKGSVDLQSDKKTLIPLHFNLRHKESAVIRNSLIDDKWGQEERSGGVPFKEEQPFNITIKCEQNDFKIDVNSKPFTTYKHRVDASTIRSIHVSGIFNVSKISYTTIEKC